MFSLNLLWTLHYVNFVYVVKKIKYVLWIQFLQKIWPYNKNINLEDLVLS